jgi:hypothetical protein
MGAADLLAADSVLAASVLSSTSASLTGQAKAAAVLAKAADSLKNAQAMAAASH